MHILCNMEPKRRKLDAVASLLTHTISVPQTIQTVPRADEGLLSAERVPRRYRGLSAALPSARQAQELRPHARR